MPTVRHRPCLAQDAVPRRKRERKAGIVFHVLNRAAKRALLFEHAGDYVAFEQLLKEGTTRSEVAFFSYCIMPNHWHLVLTPIVDGGLSRFMHWLTTTHARRWQDAHGLTGHGAVYQGRFKAIPIEADRHFLWVCRYVERNPVRAGLVERAEDWPSSSLKWNSDVPLAWLAEWPIPKPSDWWSQVNRPQTEAELQTFRRAMHDRVPFGDEDWRRKVEELLEAPTRRPRGRPRQQPLAAVL